MMDDNRGVVGNGGRRTIPSILMMALALALSPGRAGAVLTVTLQTLDNPVPPGGVVTYQIELQSSGTNVPYCFNPPPECIGTPATCLFDQPTCVGDSFVGFVCASAANNGANCGVGDPPVPDLRLCVAKTTGVCNGGNNTGRECSQNADCPGTTYTCTRSYNDGTYCGSGIPPIPVNGFCLQNPTGICSAGPNFGQPCTAPNGQVTAQCPGDTVIPPISVSLPIPAGATFMDADNGGTSDGVTITWSLPPFALCGDFGLPCPLVTAHLLVDTTAVPGTAISTQATAIDNSGAALSTVVSTTIGTFGRTRMVLGYPVGAGKDFLIYRTRMTLSATQAIYPSVEVFELVISDSVGPVVDITVPAGDLRPTGAYHRLAGWSFRSRGAGLNRLLIEQKGPYTYWVSLGATRMDLIDLASMNVTATITLGDDVFSQPLTLVPNRTGRRFIKVAN